MSVTRSVVAGKTYLAGPWIDLLSGNWEPGAIAQPNDSVGSSATWNGTQWTGGLGTFTSGGAIRALPTSKIAAGAFAQHQNGNMLDVLSWNGTNWTEDVQASGVFSTLAQLLASTAQGVPLTVAGVAGCNLMLNASGKFEGSLGFVGAYSNLPAAAANLVRARATVNNAFSPTGYTDVYCTGTLWAPVDGQVLYNSLSRAALDTVTGLAAGVVAEIWTSPILPDWYFPEGARNELTLRASVYDASSTDTTMIAANIASGASSSTDAMQSVLGYNTAASAYEAGIADGFAGVTWRDASAMRSRGGNMNAYPSGPGTLVTRNIGGYAAGAMRIRLRVAPGATTNVFRPYGARLVAGGIEA